MNKQTTSIQVKNLKAKLTLKDKRISELEKEIEHWKKLSNEKIKHIDNLKLHWTYKLRNLLKW